MSRQTRQICRDRLAEPDLQRVAEAADAAGVDAASEVALVRSMDWSAASRERVARWMAALDRAGATEPGAAERYLLLVSALQALDALPGLPVGGSVRARFADAFRRMATLPLSADRDLYTAAHERFASACHVVSLLRFPAGEFDWVVSGVPRSWMLKVDRRDLPRVLYTIAFELRGFAPTFTSHLGLFRATRSMSEVENNRSFYRIAEAMAMQPGIRGWTGSSWMRSPATHRVSPNLAWMNRTLLENGGAVTNIGPADPSEGVLAFGRTRQAAYWAGAFSPMIGFGIWPRRAMLAWAARHPELADPLPYSAPSGAEPVAASAAEPRPRDEDASRDAPGPRG